MNFQKHIPNIITLLNLFCGCVAILFIVQQQFDLAFYSVCLGIFLDFFDGFFARLFHVSSPLGLQLDSLADMTTSGIVPGLVMFFMMLNGFGLELTDSFNLQYGLCFLGFIITLGSCYRLAKFNIDTRQTDSFIGLPTPANTLFILSLPLVIKYSNSLIILDVLSNYYVLLFISLASAYLLNAEIPLFSLKIKKINFKNNKLVVLFLSGALLLLLLLQFLGIPVVILFYILLSVVNNTWFKEQGKSNEKKQS